MNGEAFGEVDTQNQLVILMVWVVRYWFDQDYWKCFEGFELASGIAHWYSLHTETARIAYECHGLTVKTRPLSLSPFSLGC